MDTLLLDLTSWDLVLDVNANIAVASDPYSITQDICSAVRLFLGELYYDTAKGVPYDSILGKFPSLEFVKAQVVAAALTVPQVLTAECYFTGLDENGFTGQIQYTYSPADASATSTSAALSGTVTFTEDRGLLISL